MPIRISRYCGLASAFESLLIDMLTPGLRSAVRRAVWRGVSRRTILRRAKLAGAAGFLLIGIQALARRCERGED